MTFATTLLPLIIPRNHYHNYYNATVLPPYPLQKYQINFEFQKSIGNLENFSCVQIVLHMIK